MGKQHLDILKWSLACFAMVMSIPAMSIVEDLEIPYFSFSGQGYYQISTVLYCTTDVSYDGTCSRPSERAPFEFTTAEAAWALSNGALPSSRLCFRFLKGFIVNGNGESRDVRRGFKRIFDNTYSRSSNAHISIGCTREEIEKLRGFLETTPMINQQQQADLCTEPAQPATQLSAETN